MRGGVRIVHEDEDVLVVDKPSGMLTAAVAGQKVREATLFDLVKDYLAKRVRRRGRKAWIIHRLDKEASGLLVFAKSEKAFEWLKEDLRAKRMHRLYSAVVEGEIAGGTPGQAASGTVQSYVYEDREGLMRSTQSPLNARRGPDGGEDEGEAKPAVTHYQVVHAGHGRSLLRVRLETGRKNQIRVHMQEIRHPIAGDRRYGARTDPLGRVCLHATELGFNHPGTGGSIRLVSPTPPAFWKLVGAPRVGADQTQGEPGDGPGRQPPPEAAEKSKSAAPVPRAVQASAERPVVGETPRAAQGWDHVAPWYDELIEDRGSDHHERVIIPGTLRLLEPAPGQRVLDVACGQGILCRRLAELGVRVEGVDASARLIESARRLGEQGGRESPRFHVGDARDLASLDLGEFDGGACLMALMNINPIEPVLEGVARALKIGGRFVGVMLHPAFRAPGQTSWGWEDEGQGGGEPRGGSTGKGPRREDRPARGVRQFRRVDGYLSSGQQEIVMNPGEVARGGTPVVTHTYHRALQAYVRAFAGAGLLVDALEEWPSLRTSQPGPRAAEENRARREIPMFVAIRGVRTR